MQLQSIKPTKTIWMVSYMSTQHELVTSTNCTNWNSIHLRKKQINSLEQEEFQTESTKPAQNLNHEYTVCSPYSVQIQDQAKVGPDL